MSSSPTLPIVLPSSHTPLREWRKIVDKVPSKVRGGPKWPAKVFFAVGKLPVVYLHVSLPSGPEDVVYGVPKTPLIIPFVICLTSPCTYISQATIKRIGEHFDGFQPDLDELMINIHGTDVEVSQSCSSISNYNVLGWDVLRNWKFDISLSKHCGSLTERLQDEGEVSPAIDSPPSTLYTSLFDEIKPRPTNADEQPQWPAKIISTDLPIVLLHIQLAGYDTDPQTPTLEAPFILSTTTKFTYLSEDLSAMLNSSDGTEDTPESPDHVKSLFIHGSKERCRVYKSHSGFANLSILGADALQALDTRISLTGSSHEGILDRSPLVHDKKKKTGCIVM